MFANQHNNSPVGRQARAVERIIRHRTGSAERIAAAQAKRERKAPKRAMDTQRARQAE
jgi:hypothetical protein